MENKNYQNIIINCENELKDTLIKLEDVQYLLKDGKQILAFNKINGIIQKIGKLYQYTITVEKELNENNPNI